ncbi:MAG TPA: peptidoglycan DD-metalloendopeptidase family protein [Candidatus Deferrimicrobium sp.]|nr:peptidoglycan DD-metalloendopeptidase family protein [Candidatus Deferrimicrobium sp.]
MLRLIALISVLLTVVSQSPVLAEKKDLLNQKNDLSQVQQQLERSRQKLDSLKSLERQKHKRISEMDQKMTSDKKVVTRLSWELRQLKSDIAQAETEQSSQAAALEQSKRKYLSNIRIFYTAARRSLPSSMEHVNDELEAIRQVTYLAALASFESSSIAQVAGYLSDSRARLAQLSGEEEKVTGLKRKKEAATALDETKKDKEQRALEQLRRKKSEEADRLVTLEQAAREIADIISRLERSREETRMAPEMRPSGEPGFASLQGQLGCPLQGKVVVGYGMAVDSITNLKSFAPGITIQGRSGQTVSAVTGGTVIYVGSLRGYGDFIIIDHDDQYYSTYAGLARIVVRTGDFVEAATPLAQAGGDGVVKFELRRGREPLDPMKWLRIGCF